MNIASIIAISIGTIPTSILLYNIFNGNISFKDMFSKKNKENTYKRRSRKGAKGETDVSRQLKLLDGTTYKVYNNLLFRLKDDVTVQIDHLVVSRRGIFVIETKNYGGVVKQLTHDIWKQIWYKYEYTFYSPVKQNESHIKSLMYVLFTKNRHWFKSIIVFPNGTSLNIYDKTPAVHCNALCKEVEKYQKQILTDEEVKMVCEKIEARNIYSKKNIKKHHERVNKLYV